MTAFEIKSVVPHDKIDGLFIFYNYLDKDEEEALVKEIDAQPWSKAMRRRVQQYGFRYDFKQRRVADAAADLPPLIALHAKQAGYVFHGLPLDHSHPPDTPFQQVIVNEYLPGQGIAPHTDSLEFGCVITALSLLSPTVMTFSRPRLSSIPGPLSKAVIDVDLPPRSMIALSGLASAHWKHGISPRTRDVLADGTVRPRERRLSVTFRHYPKCPAHLPPHYP